MLIAFRFGNHRSFRDDQELSLLVPTSELSSAVRGDSEQATSVPDWSERLQPVTAIYGANASGKSNVVDAAAFARWAVRDSFRRWDPAGGVPVWPFAASGSGSARPSFFEIEFVLDGVRYQYGFRVDRERVLEEWLYAYPNRRRQVLFERDHAAADSFYFGKHMPGQNRVSAKLVRPNALFVSVAAANGHEFLGGIAEWLRSSLRFASSSDAKIRFDFTVDCLEDPSYRDSVVTFLRAADFGVSGAVVERREITEEELRRLRARLQEASIDDAEAAFRSMSSSLARTVKLRHGDADDDVASFSLPFGEESEGTQAWFSLAGPILHVLRRGQVLFIDELEASLHPYLTAEIVQIFQDPERNPRHAQLVFTTHDTRLLGNLTGDRLLRRGQVWLTEKDSRGASTLFALTDFSPRRLENLERGYLQGRYGAVPFLDKALWNSVDRAVQSEVPNSALAEGR